MSKRFRLRDFLVTEERQFLGARIGDILGAMQKLREESPNIGKRHLMRLIRENVSQIRRLLHSNWTYDEQPYLKELQKIGVALMKGLDNNQELPALVSSCTAILEKMTEKLGEPTNNIASPSDDEKSEEES